MLAARCLGAELGALLSFPLLVCSITLLYNPIVMPKHFDTSRMSGISPVEQIHGNLEGKNGVRWCTYSIDLPHVC